MSIEALALDRGAQVEGVRVTVAVAVEVEVEEVEGVHCDWGAWREAPLSAAWLAWAPWLSPPPWFHALCTLGDAVLDVAGVFQLASHVAVAARA